MNMKSIVFASALVAAFTVSAEMKFGTVDMMALVKNHPNYENNKTLLTSTEKDYQKKLDALKKELEAIQEEGKKLSDQARNPMLAASAKQKMEKDLLDIQNKFLAGQQKLRNEAMRSQQDLQELEARLLKTTSADLRKRIGKYADANGYDFIIDASAAIFAKPSYDVTPEILKAMGVDPSVLKESKEGGKKDNESK